MNARLRFIAILTVIAVAEYGVLLSPLHARAALHVLNVGQGDATLFRTGNVDVLMDGGPDTSLLTRLGETRPPWDRTLDVLIMSHPQEDHMRGFIDVLEREHVQLVILPHIPATSQTFRRIIDLLREHHVAVRFAHPGQELRVGTTTLSILSPDAELERRGLQNPNNGCVVVRGQTPHFSFLVTGDIERPTEQYLVAHTDPALLRADILKVPHHGSKTSSSVEFLNAVKPKLSIISVGKGNPFGHPHAVTLARYPTNALVRTDQSGTVSIIDRGSLGVRLSCARGCAQITTYLAPLAFFHIPL